MAFCRTNIGVKFDEYVQNSEPHEYRWGSKFELNLVHPKVCRDTKEFSKFLKSRRPDRIDITAVRDYFYVDKASCSCCVGSVLCVNEIE